MNRICHNSFRWVMVSLTVALVAGCVGTTKVVPSHPLMGATAESTESTRVYFIRPKSGFRGVADRPLTISLDGKKLLGLSKGQYTLLSLASGTFEMKVSSYTVMANGVMTSASTRVPVTFSKGQTHYLTFDVISGGYTYAPSTLSKERAVEAVQQLTPVGMAVKEPITQH
jgi:hypothetical protein